MSKSKKIAIKAISLSAALAGSAELYNVYKMLLQCIVGMKKAEAHQLSLLLMAGSALFFQIPGSYKMLEKHSLFSHHHHHHAAAPAMSNCKITTLKVVQGLIDFLASTADAGLAFYAINEMLENYTLPKGLIYTLAGAFAVPRLVAVLGLNHAHQLPVACLEYEKIPDAESGMNVSSHTGLSLAIFGRFLFIMAASIVAGTSHSAEAFYDGNVSVGQFFVNETTCTASLLDFSTTGRAAAFIAVGFFALLIGGKSGVVEGLHVKKVAESKEGIAGWFRKSCGSGGQIFLSLGGLITSFLHSLPGAAGIASLPMGAFAKAFLSTAFILLDGLVGTFVHGKYWQQIICEMKEGLQQCMAKICHSETISNDLEESVAITSPGDPSLRSG